MGGDALAEDTDADGEAHRYSDDCNSSYVGGGERERRSSALGRDPDRERDREEGPPFSADEKREAVGGGVEAVIVACEWVCVWDLNRF